MSPADWPLVAIARSRDSRLLILVRLIRSIGQGALVVDFALYLRALHWSGGAIGALLTASMVSGIVLTAVLGRRATVSAASLCCSPWKRPASPRPSWRC